MDSSTVTPGKDNGSRDARRQQLIDATMACIYHHGLERTTINKVSNEARLSAGIINFYFGRKEQLLLETLQYIAEEYREGFETCRQQPSVQLTLEALINLHFSESICKPEKIAVWHAFTSASGSRNEYLDICGTLDSEIRNALIDWFRELSSSTKSSLHTTSLARGFEGLLDNLWIDCLYDPAGFNIADAKQQAYGYLTTLFPEIFTNEQVSADQGNVLNTLETSDLLQPWTYYNEEFLALEIEHLFKPSWILVGHISELSQPGNYLTFDAFGERALVLRDDQGELRAFHNVCRHRGAKLMSGMGSDCPHFISCPFHGWSYSQQGELVAVPARNTFEDFDKSRNGLVPVELEQWMGFVFIRFQSGSQPLAEQMKPVEDIISIYKIEQMTPIAGSAYSETRPYNWKVIHDIDNEGYHVPVGHPSLQQLYGTYVDQDIQGIPHSAAVINDKIAKLWSVRNYQKLLPKFEYLPQQYQRMWQYIGIFPNMVIGLYPDSIEFYMTLPVTIDSTIYRGASFALPDRNRTSRALHFLNRRINSSTEQEDESFVLQMQQGLRSSALPVPKLSSQEQGVRQFHKSVQKRLPVANLMYAPDTANIAKLNADLSS